MRFNSVKGGDYSSGARAVNRNSDAAFDASRRSGFNFTDVSIASQKARSTLRKAADRLKGTREINDIRDAASDKINKMSEKTADKVSDIKRPAQRMAGIVGGLGALSTGAVLYKNIQDDKAAAAKRDAKSDAYFAQFRELINNQNRDPFVPGTPPAVKPPQLAPLPPATSTTTSSSSSHVPGDVGMQHMKAMVANGYSPTNAAALTGHAHFESDGFRAMEEYVANDYGTKGYGHLQWTNIPGGSQRRTAFETYARNTGLKPSSFEANSGFLLHEMRNVPDSWTGGKNFKEFMSLTDLDQASDYLHSGFIRPRAGSEQARRDLGHQYLERYNSLNQ